MKYIVRVMLTIFVILVIYLLIYRICFSNDFRSTGRLPQWIALSIALVCGIGCWSMIGKISNSAGGYMAGLAILGGFIGLMTGLWAPIIFMSSNNLAPLLGMVMFTPAGLLAGAVLGLMQWKMKKNLPKL